MASRIKGITLEINGSTTKLEKALKDVNSKISETQRGLKDVDRLLKLDPKNTELLTQKQGYLKDAIDATKEKLEKEKKALEQMKEDNSTGEVTEQQKALEREIAATGQELKKLEKSYKDFGSVAGQQLQAAGQSMKDTGDKISKTGEGLTKKVTIPIAGVAAAAVKTTADFDSQMSKVSAISGATGKDFDALREKAREMGAKTKFSATEAGQGFEYMAMAGWKTGDMLDGIEGIMNLAAASGEDLGTTSDIVTDALTGFGLSAKDAGHFSDILATASSNANTNVSMMGETFKYVAPVAGSLGYSAEDVAESIGLMANAGIKSSQAGTSLRSIMTRLSTDAGASSKSLGALGILTEKLGVQFYNSDGTVRDFNTVIGECREAWKGLTAEEQQNYAKKIAGTNAISGWNALMNASGDDVDKLHDAIVNCDGASEKMANTMNDNLSGQLTILMSQLQELAISVGDILMPKLREIVSWIQGIVDKFNKMDEKTKKLIVTIGLIVAAVGPLLIIIGKTIWSIGAITDGIGKTVKTVSNVSKAITAAGGLIPAITSAVTAAAPFLIGGAIIAGIIAAVVLIVKNWEKIKETASDVIKAVKETLSGFLQSIKDLGENIKQVWEGIKTAITKVWNGITEAVSVAWETIKKVVEFGLLFIKELISAYFQIITLPFRFIWENCKDEIIAAWNTIKKKVSDTLNAIKDTIGAAWNAVKTALVPILNAIKTVISAAWDAIKTGVITTVNAIKTVIMSVWNGIKAALIPIINAIKTVITDAWENVKAKISTVLNGIKEVVSSSWNKVKDTVSGIVDRIKEKISSGFGAAKKVVTDIFSDIKSAITKPLDDAKKFVSSAIDAIKKKFDFSWSFPDLKLPHFSIDGEFSLNPPSVPHLAIDWYAKAMDNAMILNKATIFGMSGNTALAGGERGPEVVSGLNTLMDMIKNALRSVLTSVQSAMQANVNVKYGDVNIVVYGVEGQDVRELANEVADRIKNTYDRDGAVWA